MMIDDDHPIVRALLVLVAVLFFLSTASFTAKTYINKQIELERIRQHQKFQLLIKEMVKRESSGRHEGCWGKAGEYGAAQWLYSSFEYWKKKMKMPRLEWTKRADQIVLMCRVVQAGHGYEWTVYKKAYRTVYGQDPPSRGVRIISV